MRTFQGKKKNIITSTILKTYLQYDWQDEEVVYNFFAHQGTGCEWNQYKNLAVNRCNTSSCKRSFIHSTHDSLEFMCPKDNLKRRQDALLYNIIFYKYSVRCWSFPWGRNSKLELSFIPFDTMGICLFFLATLSVWLSYLIWFLTFVLLKHFVAQETVQRSTLNII